MSERITVANRVPHTGRGRLLQGIYSLVWEAWQQTTSGCPGRLPETPGEVGMQYLAQQVYGGSRLARGTSYWPIRQLP
jgi:hypothetical protein